MKTSQTGIDLIKKWEGYSGKSVKLSGEQYYTWGYGHYGADVPASGTITMAQAETLLKMDLSAFETHVNLICSYLNPNQNEFDAFVSFCYNLGSANLKKLTGNGKRNREEIKDHWLAYINSGNNSLYKQGLLNRRKAELSLFNTPVIVEVKTPNGCIRTSVDIEGDKVTGFILDGTTFAPVRKIVDALSNKGIRIKIEWDSLTKTSKIVL